MSAATPSRWWWSRCGRAHSTGPRRGRFCCDPTLNGVSASGLETARDRIRLGGMLLPRSLVCLALGLVPVVRGELFPKPDPAHAFAEMKVYDAAGHPWRGAQEDWTGAKRRVASDPAWAKWLEGERAAVDRWMAKHHDRVEWVAGWSHDGVSPKDGSHLRWTEEIPGEETDHFASPSDPRVEFTPKLIAW